MRVGTFCARWRVLAGCGIAAAWIASGGSGPVAGQGPWFGGLDRFAGPGPAGPPTTGGTPVTPAVTPAANLKKQLLAQENRVASSTDRLIERLRPRATALAAAYVPGHLVVKFAEGADDRVMTAAASTVAASRVWKPSYADFTYVEIPADLDPVAAAARVAAMPGVVYAEPDGRVVPVYRPNDPFYRYQWNLQRLDMERAWDINPGAQNSVTVAVIDSGVAYLTKGGFAQAPEFAGTRFAPGYDFVWDDDEPVDMDGHGTHVAGTIAQTTNNSLGVAGMAFNVTIMPLKAIYTDWDERLGAPYPYGASTIARAVRFAADNGAKVINMSIGSLSPNTASRDAIVYAIGKGVFVAVSGGNEGDSGNTPFYPAVYAKDIDGAMAVAAVDYNLTAAYYSNRNDYIEIAAPGGDVTADENNDGFGDGVLQQTLDFDARDAGIFNQFDYVFEQGTSMAAPHVSALAALLYDQGVTNPAAIEAALKKFATDVGPQGRDDQTGFGLINPRATLRGLGLLR